MKKVSTEEKTYIVRSLDELRKILALVYKQDLKHIFVLFCITVLVFIINCFLNLLKFLLFRHQNIEKTDFRHIVIYTVGIVGDNVVMLPAVAALRKKYPEAEITVIANGQSDGQGALGVFELSPWKDKLIILDDHPVQWRNFKFVMEKSKYEKVKCDLFVNLSPYGNKGWIGAVLREMIFAKKIGAEYAIGFRLYNLARRGKLTRAYPLLATNEPRRAKDVLSELGISPVENEDLFSHNSKALESVIKKLEMHGVMVNNFFVINPGGKIRYQCWRAARYGRLAQWLINHYGASVVITGVASENEIAEEVVETSGKRAVNLAGKTTLHELFELLRLSRGCVTNDTGTMHIAAMIGTPTVALFSQQQSPVHWLPLGKNVISLFSPISCGYCYNNQCNTLACLDSITEEDVIKAIDKLLTNDQLDDVNGKTILGC